MPTAVAARWAIGRARSVVAGGLCRRAARRTLYDVLGLSPGADEAEIKAAYRDLARRLHPDANAGDAALEQRLSEVNQAYETLSDPRARSAYDQGLAWQRNEMRRHYSIFAASTGAMFVVTFVAVSYLVRWYLQAEPSAAPAASETLGRSTPVSMPAMMPAASGVAAGPGLPQAAEGGLWSTFRDARFAFTLRYPAGIFVFDPAQSDANVHTFVSRDRRAIFRIVAAENTAGVSLARFRSTLIKRRYAGASFEQTPRSRHWFALGGRQGDEAFLERVTFSCDGKSMHGWQMRYPASQRATYDEIARLVLRNHPHGNEPADGCGRAKPKQQWRQRARRRRD